VERHLIEWLTRDGPHVLFFAQLFGIFGLPIPDELLLTIAGFLVRQHRLDGRATVFAAITGAAAGMTISYVLGRTLGSAVVQRAARAHPSAVARAQAWFRRFGCWLLAFGYFIPGVRHVTAISAGSTRLSYLTFSMYAYPGAAVWSLTFLGLGYFAETRAQLWLDAVRAHLAALAIAISVAVVAYAFWVVRRTRSQRDLSPADTRDHSGD
jgi:membrane protein DedA with SNARE-associated domain